MAFDAGSVVGHFTLDSSGYTSGAEKIGKSNTSMAGSMFKANLAYDAFKQVVSGVVNVLKESVTEFVNQEKAEKQLETVLKSTGNAAGITKNEVLELSQAFQKSTTFADEVILSGQNLLLTFTKIGRDVFPQATEVMLDMSQALGQDLKSSAVQLGKALQDPVLGVTALRRVGVNFSDAQRDVIKSLVATNQLAEAQAMILRELQTEFGGSAKAARDTFGGSIIALNNTIGEVKETFGGMLAEGLKPIVQELTKFFEDLNNNKELMQSFSDLVTGLGAAFLNITKFVIENHKIILALLALLIGAPAVFTAVSGAVTSLGSAFGAAGLAAAANPIGLVVAGIAALTIGIIAAKNAADDLDKKMQNVTYSLRNSITSVEDFKKKFEDAFFVRKKDLTPTQIKNEIKKINDELVIQEKNLKGIQENYSGLKLSENGRVLSITKGNNEYEETKNKLEEQNIIQNAINKLIATRDLLQQQLNATSEKGNIIINELSSIQKEWIEELAQLSETEKETEIRHINEKAAEYLAAGAKRVDIERWVNEQIAIINEDARIEEEKKALEQAEKLKKIQEDAAREITEKFNFAFSTLQPLLSSIGAALVSQGESWKDVGKAGVLAIAAIIKALGDQLAAEAAAKLVLAIANSFYPLNLSGAAPGLYAASAIMAAGASAAYVASGALEAWAGSFASGGVARPGVAMVGERGPELVSIGSTSRIEPADVSESLLGETIRRENDTPIMAVINLNERELFRAIVMGHRDGKLVLER